CVLQGHDEGYEMVRRPLPLLLAVFVAMALGTSTRVRATSCDDQCHHDQTSGGGCSNSTKEDPELEARSVAACEGDRSPPPPSPAPVCAHVSGDKRDCCAGAYPLAAQLYENELMRCLCTPDACESACADFDCGGGRPRDSGCSACLAAHGRSC